MFFPGASSTNKVRAELELNSTAFVGSSVTETPHDTTRPSRRTSSIQKSLLKRKLLEATRVFSPTPYGSRQESLKKIVEREKKRLTPKEHKSRQQKNAMNCRKSSKMSSGHAICSLPPEPKPSKTKKEKFDFNFKETDKELQKKPKTYPESRVIRRAVRRLKRRPKPSRNKTFRKTRIRLLKGGVKKHSRLQHRRKMYKSRHGGDLKRYLHSGTRRRLVRRKRMRKIKRFRCPYETKPRKIRCYTANKVYPSSGRRTSSRTSSRATSKRSSDKHSKKSPWKKRLVARAAVEKAESSPCSRQEPKNVLSQCDKKDCRSTRHHSRCNCQKDRNHPHYMYLVKRCLFNFPNGANEKEITHYVRSHNCKTLKLTPAKFARQMKKAIKNMVTLGYAKKNPIYPSRFILTSKGRIMRLGTPKKKQILSRHMARRLAKYKKRKRSIVKLH